MSAAAPVGAAPSRTRAGLTPERLRSVLLRRGPVGIKAAQFLVLRPDVLPAAYVRELTPLLDAAPAVAWADVQRVIRAELGTRSPGLLEWVDPAPLATGSIAQVHVATLTDGRHVAVKVQRPDARPLVDRELPRLRRLLRVLDLAGVLGPFRAADLAREFSDWLDEELDFRRELSNGHVLVEASRGIEGLVVAEPVPELCGDRVVTTELLDGQRFSRILRSARLQPDPSGRLRPVADRLLLVVLRQVLETGVFHADPHPGNLLLLPDGRIGLVDHGLVRRLDQPSREALLVVLEAVASGDAARVHHGLEPFLVGGPDADPEGFRSEFEQLFSAFTSRGDDPVGGTGPSPVARLLTDVMAAARRHGMAPTPTVLAVYRTLLVVEVLAGTLSPASSLSRSGRAVYVRVKAREFTDALRSERLLATLSDTVGLAGSLPAVLSRLLHDLDEDRLELAVRTTESSADRRVAAARARLGAACLLVIADAVLLASPRALLGTVSRTTVVLGVVMAVLLGVVGWLWRRVR